MAGIPLLPDGIALPRSVQEMSVNRDEPPPDFLFKDNILGLSNSSSAPDSSVSVPIIDLSLLSTDVEQEKLRSALTSAGCFQIMSNGIFKSPLHRVVTNTDQLRISIAMFIESEQDREIGPVEDLIDAERPRMYRNVKNYAAFNYECFQKGKVALEEVRIDA